jgi:hypothetical protein
MTDILYSLDFYEPEIEALLIGLSYVNAYYGLPASPPTPGMTAATKLGDAIDAERYPA